MKKLLDKILLSILWILLISIGCLFWCEQKYNFNIFSKSHWKYLSELQATNTLINNSFYLSLIISIAICLFGLYIIVRPHFRCIALKHQNKTIQPIDDIPAHIQKEHTQPQIKKDIPIELKDNQNDMPLSYTQKFTRPPRLTLNQTQIISHTQTTSKAKELTNNLLQDKNYLYDIFSEYGYKIKKCNKIGKLHPDLLAINSPNIIWIGAIGIDSTTMTDAINSISDIFNETLDDIEIQINAFIIKPTIKNSDNIFYFNSTDDLKYYISKHPATEITNEDQENFDAYSEYIDTVLSYIGKI